MTQRFAIAPRLGVVLAGAALAAVALIGPGNAPQASAQVSYGPTVRQASGSAAANIQSVVDAFRADLGGANNAANAPAHSGRREINWDGVPDARSAPNNLPADFFNTTSPRGVVFVSSGPGFQVSANEGVAPVRFGTINPAYESSFSTFSAQRLFTALESNVYDVQFFVPGTSTSALTSGFGAVFTNVNLREQTSIEYFGASGVSLGRWRVPVSERGGLSFLGVSFSTPTVAWVRITAGNAALGPYTVDNGTDNVVALDDFIYGEPQPAP